MTTGTPLLRVEDLEIRARFGSRDRTIVSGVQLSVGSGETIGIVGESGSGKSMTARALIGLLPAGLYAQGTVEYGGRNLIELPERSLRQLRGPEIGPKSPGTLRVLVLGDSFAFGVGAQEGETYPARLQEKGALA